MKKTFAGIPKKYAKAKNAKIYLTSIPYDGTSTWGKGADKGFSAFLRAAENMELYDIETDYEVYRNGIYITPSIDEKSSPKAMYQSTLKFVKTLLQKEKFLTFFGGEHSISIGIIKAHYQHFKNLTVLQIDAHADLRPKYNGSKYNHACAVFDANKNTNLIQVGIRSMDISEKKYMNKKQTYFAHKMAGQNKWMNQAISQMTKDVYITFDLDAFDPSIMPSTGTPEPGGMMWYETLQFLRKVFAKRNVVGFDIVELAPNESNPAPDFLAAKLYYKMLSYKFMK